MKKQITFVNLLEFKRNNGINSIREFRLLMEGFRRKHFLGANENFMGLGVPSLYAKSAFFEVSTPPATPKIVHWWKLTDRGKSMMQKLEESFFIPTSSTKLNEINLFLYQLTLKA